MQQEKQDERRLLVVNPAISYQGKKTDVEELGSIMT
jgi:hypothetical protein